MGLLDSVLGAVLGGGHQEQAPAVAGGLGSLIGLLASNPQILSTITSMLSNDGDHGGLGGLVGKFQQAGMGDAIGSWIGTGANQAVTGDQLGNVLGADALSGLAQKMGLNEGDAGSVLAQVLPELISHMTPAGQAPTAGLGNTGDLMGMLGGLLNRKA
ncbi:MAG: YidB family protein [Burkholderiaceae bacterium]